MAAKYKSSQVIRNILKGQKTVTVAYVDKTTAWTRASGFPSAEIKENFAKVVEENIDKLLPNTAQVAMKESEHQSDADKRKHYTAYELNAAGEVLRTSHFVRQL